MTSQAQAMCYNWLPFKESKTESITDNTKMALTAKSRRCHMLLPEVETTQD